MTQYDILAVTCGASATKATSCSMKQTVNKRTACARVRLPLMLLTVAFGNNLQLTEQKKNSIRQRRTETKETQNEMEKDIDRAETEKECCSLVQFNKVINSSSHPFVL